MTIFGIRIVTSWKGISELQPITMGPEAPFVPSTWSPQLQASSHRGTVDGHSLPLSQSARLESRKFHGPYSHDIPSR